jgi:SAM-dependent methyltransferase
MNEDDQTTPVARAAELVQRGPDTLSNRTRRGWRVTLRRVLLRAMRPYTYHQRELDAEIVAAIQHFQDEFESVSERQAEQIERLEDIARELIVTAEALRKATSDSSVEAAEAGVFAERALAGLEPLEAELQAPPYMAGVPFETFRAPAGEVIGFRSHAAGRKDGSDYVAFEDIFRGPAERVAESQLPYLDLVRDHQPVLDVGCGRGEFLTLLAREGIAARGVDSDPGMVARCRELGIEVVEGDINEHLERVADGALGAVFSAQVIEHLPYDGLRRMLELALAKLRPGGLLIAETVNPHRISSLKTFWVDLTHQHPIFPEVALALCGIAGFESAYVFAPMFDSFESARLEAPAYAVVASSPGSGSANT